jgi:hypothetical protein
MHENKSPEKTVNNLKHNLEIQETKHQMELLKKDLEIEQKNQRKCIEFDFLMKKM